MCMCICVCTHAHMFVPALVPVLFNSRFTKCLFIQLIVASMVQLSAIFCVNKFKKMIFKKSPTLIQFFPELYQVTGGKEPVPFHTPKWLHTIWIDFISVPTSFFFFFLICVDFTFPCHCDPAWNCLCCHNVVKLLIAIYAHYHGAI